MAIHFVSGSCKSGTNYMAFLLDHHSKCKAVHEPHGNKFASFVIWMNTGDKGQEARIPDLWKEKVEESREYEKETGIYVESDFKFIQSYCDLAAEEFKPLKIISLSRDPVKVARQVCRNGYFIRNYVGWMNNPNFPKNLVAIDKDATQIQKGIWYTHEIAMRKKRFSILYPEVEVFEFDMDNKNLEMLEGLLAFLGLEMEDKIKAKFEQDPIVNSWEKRKIVVEYSYDQVKKEYENFEVKLKNPLPTGPKYIETIKLQLEKEKDDIVEIKLSKPEAPKPEAPKPEASKPVVPKSVVPKSVVPKPVATDSDLLPVERFKAMCYPKHNQTQHIFGEDVAYLVPLMREEQPKVIVEIGASYGTSSKLFATIAKETGGKLYCVEPNVRPEWKNNMEEYNLLPYAEMMEAASPWVNWEGKPEIDVLFIDGFHNYRNVFVDFFYWQRYVKAGGLIIFHDTISFPAVKRAINEILNTEFLEFVGASKSRIGLEAYRKVEDKRGKVAFFGPWVGELGFEVAWWQGYCRKQSRNFDYTICSTYPGNEVLYEDFADEVQPHQLVGNPMCGYANNLRGDFDYPNVTKVFAPPGKRMFKNEEQEFYMFGSDDPNTTYDVLIHVNEAKRKEYPFWNVILEHLKGKKIACFGKKDGNFPDGYLEGTSDIRSIPMRDLVKYLNGAKLVLGPGSGAMHLASYCGAKIVVWCNNSTYTFGQTLRQRYETILNPFNSPVTVIDQHNWTPPADVVINAISEYL